MTQNTQDFVDASSFRLNGKDSRLSSAPNRSPKRAAQDENLKAETLWLSQNAGTSAKCFSVMRIPLKFLPFYPGTLMPGDMNDGDPILVLVDEKEFRGLIRTARNTPTGIQCGLFIEIPDQSNGTGKAQYFNLSQEVARMIKPEPGEGGWKLIHSTAFKALTIPDRFRQTYPEVVRPPKMKEGAKILLHQKKVIQDGLINAVGQTGPVESGVVISVENVEAPLFTCERIHLPQDLVNNIKYSSAKACWKLKLPTE